VINHFVLKFLYPSITYEFKNNFETEGDFNAEIPLKSVIGDGSYGDSSFSLHNIDK
jgi:hypothetical protein